MNRVKLSTMAAALVLTAAPVFAQAPKPQTPPAPSAGSGQAPATGAGQAPATAPPPAPRPPVPFPQDAKYAFVDVQGVAGQSAAGKAAATRLKTLTDEKQKA